MAQDICGCYYVDAEYPRTRVYLPQIKVDGHTTIQSLASRTVLKQYFHNTSPDIDEIRYTFPLFDGASVVDFVCSIGERTIYSLVKPKGEAKGTYMQAKARGNPNAANVFTTSLSNIPSETVVEVTITYVQELKNDDEVDGVRFTLPTKVAPRYKSYPGMFLETPRYPSSENSFIVDISMSDEISIQKVMSPSHPLEIEISLGSLSTSGQRSPSNASATLALGTAPLDEDFVLQVIADIEEGVQQAVLETHPTIFDQRALIATLVPKFSLKNHEVIFLADRSLNWDYNWWTMKTAMKTIMKYVLKSLPADCIFNIYSFGVRHGPLWLISKPVTESNLREAIAYIDGMEADWAYSNTLPVVRESVNFRRVRLSTDLILFTRGDIESQEQNEMTNFLSRITNNTAVRVFPIGIGRGISSKRKLIEGIARAGNGFGQTIESAEIMTNKDLRMLKAALMSPIKDCQLEIKYDDDSIEKLADIMGPSFDLGKAQAQNDNMPQAHAKPISLPNLDPPQILQTPLYIPPLYPFQWTCIYLLMSPETSHLIPKALILKGTSAKAPVEIEIPIEIRNETDQMIHQLAARKAIQELEEGRGWVVPATAAKNGLMSKVDLELLAKRSQKEAVRLGVEFQVACKFCSTVAVECDEVDILKKREDAKVLDQEVEEETGLVQTEISTGVKGGNTSSPFGARSSHAHESGFESENHTSRTRTTYSSTTTTGFGQAGSASESPFDHASPSGGNPSGVPGNAVSGSPFAAFGNSIGGSPFGGLGNAMNGCLFGSPGNAAASGLSTNAGTPTPMGLSTGGLFGINSPFSALAGAGNNSSLVTRLVNQQSVNGSWLTFASIPFTEMGLKQDQVLSNFTKPTLAGMQKAGPAIMEALVATILVVLHMEKAMAGEKHVWKSAVEKARTFIEGVELKVGKDVAAECWKVGESLTLSYG
ncbi:hypothetical protein DM02DRAFT_585513 [Periconia macrospinosa]|uniref:VIT-domain-containing protein n=1 Tax=Periconia macrospinosa TaxID=97972 RepID=A0A2V1E2W2_9PLEO|nr:hypothetical protein DM02DRAFT_585513 [Periconia macrospinosa]